MVHLVFWADFSLLPSISGVCPYRVQLRAVMERLFGIGSPPLGLVPLAYFPPVGSVYTAVVQLSLVSLLLFFCLSTHSPFSVVLPLCTLTGSTLIQAGYHPRMRT